MFIPEDSPIKTKTFQIERNSYARAKLLEVLKKLGPVALIIYLVLGATFLLSTSEPVIQEYILLGFSTFFCGLILIVIAKLYDSKTEPLYEVERTLEFCDEWIYAEARDAGETRMKWKLITKASRSAGWTFLFQDSITAIAVPDSAFLNDDDLHSFQSLIARKFAKK